MLVIHQLSSLGQTVSDKYLSSGHSCHGHLGTKLDAFGLGTSERLVALRLRSLVLEHEEATSYAGWHCTHLNNHQATLGVRVGSLRSCSGIPPKAVDYADFFFRHANARDTGYISDSPYHLDGVHTFSPTIKPEAVAQCNA